MNRNDLSSGDAGAARTMRVIRIAALLLFALWVGRYLREPEVILHGSILIFHEAGHALFMPFGEFMMVLGGSLFQLLLPLVIIGIFVRRRDFYAACVVALYLAASMDNVATYIADARAGDLPLLGGDRTNHDWTFLLIELGRLDRDITIGRFVHNVANTIFWIALPAGLWFAWHRGRHDDERDAAPNAPRRDIIVTTSNWKET
jgi:hypothetical protein